MKERVATGILPWPLLALYVRNLLLMFQSKSQMPGELDRFHLFPDNDLQWTSRHEQPGVFDDQEHVSDER
ncbi:MAG: hypothetical protein ACLPX5_12140 [Dissulfurispiraceae bacterium]